MVDSLNHGKVIVGILSKDCAQQLRQCLDSLLNQSFTNFEVVVVDGGSKDNSLHLLKEYSQKDKRVHYFVQRSKGTGMARNELIDYVRKNLPECQKIVWGDAENVYDQNYLQNIVSKSASVVGGTNIVDSRKPLAQSLWWYYNGLRGDAVSGNNECVDIKVYDKHWYINALRGEDFVFHRELVKESYKLDHCSQAVCYIKTAESFGDFIDWTRRKARGFSQWASQRRGVMLPLFLRYFLFNALMWSYILLLFLLVLTLPYLLLPYLLLPLMLSLYFWQKGKLYVKGMKKITFFYFLPVLFLHFSVLFYELLKLTVSKTPSSREPLSAGNLHCCIII